MVEMDEDKRSYFEDEDGYTRQTGRDLCVTQRDG